MHAGSAGYSSMFAKDFAREVPAELIHCRLQTDQKIDPQCFQPSMHNKKKHMVLAQCWPAGKLPFCKNLKLPLISNRLDDLQPTKVSGFAPSSFGHSCKLQQTVPSM
jgi:hypothetical protein